MDEEQAWYEQVVIPALLRGARRTYGAAIRRAHEAAGFSDIPRNGSYVLGSLARSSAPLSRVIAELGVSKQAAGQLVDTLVVRGYLERQADADDRRRLTVALTERGAAAATASADAVAQVDANLIARLGEAKVAAAREVLGTLIDLSHPPDTGPA